MDEVIRILGDCDLFAGMDRRTIQTVASQCRMVRFAANEIVCREGDSGDCCFIIGAGEVSVLKDMGWGERELRKIGSGEAFGEMALISDERRAATIRTLCPTECVVMERQEFNDLLEQSERFAQQMLRVLTGRMQNSQDQAARDILQSQQALIFALANLAESRDPETGAHLKRVRDYCALLSEMIRSHPKFRSRVSMEFIESVYFISPLHDIGKVGVPDSILLKQGRLSPVEFEVMKGHTRTGSEALKTVLEFCDQETFRMAYRLILWHHERYDGKGYPHGLKGEEIPLEARIMSLADVYDALLSRRVYKPPFTFEQAHDKIREGMGTQFDPVLSEVMLSNIAGFEKIHDRYQSEDEASKMPPQHE